MNLVFKIAALSALLGSALIVAAPAVRFDPLPTPAPARSLGGAMTVGPDGTLWLSWVEPGADGAASGGGHHGHAAATPTAPNALRFSTLAIGATAWSAPRLIVRDNTVPTSSADFPQLVVDGAGRVLAVWTDGRGGAFVSESTDAGQSWSARKPWTTASAEVEKFSFVRLADGRILAAWLDGRSHQTGGKLQQLFARIVGGSADDVLVDLSVCDCCQTTLTALLDGGALLGYRGRTSDEIRDIRVARFRDQRWDEPRPLNHDGWRINACPINGPRLASDGSRVAAAWFTAADGEPRVLASFSPDAAGRWLRPLRLDRGQPVGHVDTVLLRDGAMLVTWLESDGSLWLRRVSPDFNASEPIALAPPGAATVKCVPRVALRRDYAGGKTETEMVVLFTGASATAGGVQTLRVTVPEGEWVNAERNCDCAPTPEQLQGFSIRGVIRAIDAGGHSVRVRHAEVPGVLTEGESEFRVAPDLLSAIRVHGEFLGRIERRDGQWWLFDVRWLTTPVGKPAVK